MGQRQKRIMYKIKAPFRGNEIRVFPDEARLGTVCQCLCLLSPNVLASRVIDQKLFNFKVNFQRSVLLTITIFASNGKHTADDF